MRTRRAAALFIAQLLALPALAQTPATKPAPAPVSAEPQTTTAGYGDWLLRCQRVGEGAALTKVCEIAVTIQNNQQQTVAELAMGRLAKTDPIHITAHLPVNISMPGAVKFTTGGKDARGYELPWRRCVSAGCYADSTLPDAQWKALRNQTEPGALEFADAAGRPVKIPVSFRGLPQAIDALAKE